jgi:hypothetical protein
MILARFTSSGFKKYIKMTKATLLDPRFKDTCFKGP